VKTPQCFVAGRSRHGLAILVRMRVSGNQLFGAVATGDTRRLHVGWVFACNRSAMRPNDRRAFHLKIGPRRKPKGRQRGGGSHSMRPVIHVPPLAALKSLSQR
jgi:hypothetical protein